MTAAQTLHSMASALKKRGINTHYFSQIIFF
jgi:hypothetical protein